MPVKMASGQEDQETAVSSTTTSVPTPTAPTAPTTQSNKRVRRRQKRQGPPQLQFVTATDPSQFKGEAAKRSVRSQAMIQYRYQAVQEHRSASVESNIDIGVKERGKRKHSTPQTASPEPREHQPSQSPISPIWTPDFYDNHSSTSSHTSRYRHALALLPPNPNSPRVTDYEHSNSNEEKNMQELFRQLAFKVGNGGDPFLVLPQFDSPELNSLYLVSKAHRGFTSQATMVTWIPAMLVHPHLILSATALASTWLDMHRGISGDSRDTVLIKSEVISWINQRLQTPSQQFEDNTLVVILHLMAGEMWSADERTLRIHEQGVARLIGHRGGLGSMNGVMAAIAACVCFHTDIFCEAPVLPLFRSFEPSPPPLVDSDVVLPESPLFSLRRGFPTILRYKRCSERTYEIICDLRDLTDLFLDFYGSFDAAEQSDSVGDAGGSPTAQEYDTQIAEIRARLAGLPSAHTPGLPITNDWIYESCRIAAIIYASAIIMRAPFSFVSQPGCAVLLSDIAAITGTADPLASRRLSDSLYEALEKSGTADIWGDMCGVLYFVAIVGAAAARVPMPSPTQSSRHGNNSHTLWVRRCLIMFATRTMIILIFQYPHAVISAQNKLIKVQEMIGTHIPRQYKT